MQEEIAWNDEGFQRVTPEAGSRPSPDDGRRGVAVRGWPRPLALRPRYAASPASLPLNSPSARLRLGPARGGVLDVGLADRGVVDHRQFTAFNRFTSSRSLAASSNSRFAAASRIFFSRSARTFSRLWPMRGRRLPSGRRRRGRGRVRRRSSICRRCCA